jgi:hypothetical protein
MPRSLPASLEEGQGTAVMRAKVGRQVPQGQGDLPRQQDLAFVRSVPVPHVRLPHHSGLTRWTAQPRSSSPTDNWQA